MLDTYQKLVTVLNEAAIPWSEPDFDALLEKIGDARFVLLGEATHGTQEFYQTRIELSKQLIEKKGFMAIAIEGDWPDTHKIHRYIQGEGNEEDGQHALEDFKRFPNWMWRNTTMPPFLKWLRNYNDHLPARSQKIGFYGMDLYSLNASMQAVVGYLMKVDEHAASQAKKRYACFDHMAVDPQMYGYLTNKKIKNSCIKEVIKQFQEIQHHAFKYLQENGTQRQDEYFFAEQNARIVKNAEAYYQSMFESHIDSWNIRDRHMAETLNILAEHLIQRLKKPAKIIVWAHNSHIGDARATEMGERGEINVGQLVREQHPETYSIGFSTFEGFVTAASDWDEPAESKRIVPGFSETYEALFHHLKLPQFILHLRGNEMLDHYLQIPRLQRAIGVVYRPETERLSHYFFTHLPYQFDSMIHLDKTTALEPLELPENWKKQKISISG